jgi:hypothetical protein
MLLTFSRDFYEDDEEGNEVEVQRKNGFVVPDCCEAIQKSLTVVLHYDWSDLSDEPALIRHPEPPEVANSEGWEERLKWMVSGEAATRDPEGRTRFQMATPRWSTGLAVDSHRGSQVFGSGWKLGEYQIEFCPFCGTKLPDVERIPEAELPGPIHEPVADGDYCGTCDERSRSCRCFHPACAWKTKPA